MAVKIHSVSVTHAEPSENNWFHTGERITITVKVEDVSWNTIKNEFTSWGDVRTLTNWKSILNYIRRV